MGSSEPYFNYVGMGEPEALRAINDGVVDINGELFNIVKESRGFCDDCHFYSPEQGFRCPTKALNICCSGGYILKK